MCHAATPDHRTRTRRGTRLTATTCRPTSASGSATWSISSSGDPLAPTTVREPAKVLDDHLADSLVALELDRARAARRSRTSVPVRGFRESPLAIALPGATSRLVESSTRKCAFMERVVALTGARNARVFHARAESWPEGLRAFDLVTARALAPLDVVAEYAAPLLRVGGTLVAWRGRRDLEAEAAAAAAASCLGLEVHQPLPVGPYPGAEHRHLHLMSKLGETPERFPASAWRRAQATARVGDDGI